MTFFPTLGVLTVLGANPFRAGKTTRAMDAKLAKIKVTDPDSMSGSLITPNHHHQRRHRNPQTPPPSLSLPSSISPSSPASVEAPQTTHKTNSQTSTPPPLLQFEGPNPMIPSDSLLCPRLAISGKPYPDLGSSPEPPTPFTNYFRYF